MFKKYLIVILLITFFIMTGQRVSYGSHSEKLMNAYTSGGKIPVISIDSPALNVDMAYKIQRDYVNKRLKSEKIYGFKVALTSKKIQEDFGISFPVTGVLFDSGKIFNGASIDAAIFNDSRMETEIGYVVGREINKTFKSVKDLKGSIDHIIPVVELPDVGFADMKKVKAVDIIAANTASAHFIVGDNEKNSENLDVPGKISLYKDNEEIYTAEVSQTKQWETLLWLVNKIVSQGYKIRPGMVIITGAVGGMKKIGAGSSYKVDYGRHGIITFTVKKGANWRGLSRGLKKPYTHIYKGRGDGGLAHLDIESRVKTLTDKELEKAKKIAANTGLQSKSGKTYHAEVAGIEVTGVLVPNGSDRKQEVVLKVPHVWNGSLIVGGAPGVRNEFCNEKLFVPYLLERGYAYVAGNKGMTNDGQNGMQILLAGKHITQHWGNMMIDIANWAKKSIESVLESPVKYVYAIGLSNGGYQVRRALEIDHERVLAGHKRLFDGGIDWSGVYWPDLKALDVNGDGKVMPQELHSSKYFFVNNTDIALSAMDYAYSKGTINRPEFFRTNPPYERIHGVMNKAGFSSESAILWGFNNTAMDYMKAHNGFFRGAGYYSMVSFLYRADLRGDTKEYSRQYSAFSLGNKEPRLYKWLDSSENGGWRQQDVKWALKNGNTTIFSAPLISVHGNKDGLVGIISNGYAYRDAVKKWGNPELHRLYVIENGAHIDTYVDNDKDFDFNGVKGDEGLEGKLEPIKPFILNNAFKYLTEWAESGTPAPADFRL